MTHTYLPLDVTPLQRTNLQQLADYLLRPKPTAMRFDMGCFAADRDDEDLEPIRHECGAVGCAIGHGPAAGLKPLPHETSWLAYSKRVFGVFADEGSCEGELWDWCFSGGWMHTDNTSQGAGKRIQIALTLGIPSNLDDQRMGAVPLEYTP